VFVENDLRAHANPTRMAIIHKAAEDLARRMQSRCPHCGAPGFWSIERIPGLPCADCGAPTRVAKAEVLGCVRCTTRETRAVGGPGCADPAHCDECNP
jgi:hypothetical protein